MKDKFVESYNTFKMSDSFEYYNELLILESDTNFWKDNREHWLLVCSIFDNQKDKCSLLVVNKKKF